MSTPEENTKTILADWLDALRRHDLDTVERRMDPDVFWQGVREDFVCANRDEAMEMLREQQREEHGVEALELIATEERVVLGVRSTQLQEIGGVPLGGQIFQVFIEVTAAGGHNVLLSVPIATNRLSFASPPRWARSQWSSWR